MMRSMIRLFLRLARASEIFGMIMLGGIVLLNLMQVGFRYILGQPLGWTEEVMRYMVVWITFVTISAAQRWNEHMTIDVFADHLPARLVRAKHLLVQLLVAFFALIMIRYGIAASIRAWNQITPFLQITLFWPTVAVPLGGFLLLVQAIGLMLAPQLYADQSATRSES